MRIFQSIIIYSFRLLRLGVDAIEIYSEIKDEVNLS
jgi:hypothetical protein